MNFKPIFTRRNAIIAAVVVAVAGIAAFLIFQKSTGDVDSVAGQGSEVWTCSMHPQVRMPKPGKCPICSMPLIRVAAPTSANATTKAGLRDHFGFEGAKCRFAFLLKNHPDRAAGFFLQRFIGIHKRDLQMFRQVAADRRLARAHEPCQDDIHRWRTRST